MEASNPNPNLIEREWNTYRREVLPVVVSQIQLQETRRAFYAGIRSLTFALMNGLDDTGDNDDVTPADEQMLFDLEIELQQFSADVEAGKK